MCITPCGRNITLSTTTVAATNFPGVLTANVAIAQTRVKIAAAGDQLTKAGTTKCMCGLGVAHSVVTAKEFFKEVSLQALANRTPFPVLKIFIVSTVTRTEWSSWTRSDVNT